LAMVQVVPANVFFRLTASCSLSAVCRFVDDRFVKVLSSTTLEASSFAEVLTLSAFAVPALLLQPQRHNNTGQTDTNNFMVDFTGSSSFSVFLNFVLLNHSGVELESREYQSGHVSTLNFVIN